MKLILLFLAVISTSFAYLNGPCSGRSGICIDSSTCGSYGGSTYSGYCPSDSYYVKCCDNIQCRANDGRTGSCMFSSQCSGDSVTGKCPGGSDFTCCLGSSGGGGITDGLYYGPCSYGGGACINADSVTCETNFVSGKCPGSNSVKCCVAGSRPS